MWILTDKGQEAMILGTLGIIEAASAAYRTWDAERKKSHSKLIKTGIPLEVINQEKEEEITYDLIKQQAFEGVNNHIAKLQWDNFQDLVESLLTSMGYFVDFNAPKGKNGGVDIIAYQDALGIKKPRIKVQVKHHPKTPIGSDPVRSLKGV
jgi:restriction system protein